MTELLVALAVVALFVVTILPAIQATRETARMVQCKNHVRQLSFGCLDHESAHGHLPSNGWGHRWVGDPRAGVGSSQPGGWAFAILPFTEAEHLWNLVFTEGQEAGLRQLITTPLDVLYCPSRREATTYPFRKNDPYFFNGVGNPSQLARSDYVINAGSQRACEQRGPVTLRAARDYPWCPSGNGISFQRSEVRLVKLADGASKTYLVGEKFLDPLHYTTGADLSDDNSPFQGHDRDIARWTFSAPRRDQAGMSYPWSFGSPHVNGTQISMCDGSVRQLSYEVDLAIHRAAGNRSDP